MMNTERSQKKAADFLEKGIILNRKTQNYQKLFNFHSEKVFYHFCPTRELDWIEGWDCDLVYTSTGFVEEECIFTTPDTNALGPGLWIFTRYEPNRVVELVRVIDSSMVIHFRIKLTDHDNGTCTGAWNLTFTALNESGNAMLESTPDRSPELEKAIDGLEYFLEKGELRTA